MRSKPMRKNAHKERIFTLSQNRVDFDYQKYFQEKKRHRPGDLVFRHGM